jgi:uncharacterized repeat protein (TIGR01451 family)
LIAGTRKLNVLRTGRECLGFLLLVLALLVAGVSPAQAVDCSTLPNGTLDGFAGDIPPSQIQVDRNCTIRNYPGPPPDTLDTNFSFLTQPGQTDERWVIIFDNVNHTGEMACNSVANHKIWFTNGSSSSIQDGCQNLLIPVEKIDKQNPLGQTTAEIGEPFTYRLTMPVLFDPATQTVINNLGSANDLHGITVWDDLNETGVDLTYLGHDAYWEDTGEPVSHTFSNSGGLLTFDGFPIVPSGRQIVLEITVVLEDTPNNAVGTQFVNTAKWDFGRLIDGVFYEPLPGEWGITPPMTIGGPDLVVTKTGPATLGRTLNLGEWGEFAIDVHNVGFSDAWDVTLLDRLPDGPAGGMCDVRPEILSAQVFAADGSTPIPGKGPLVEGTHFTLNYSGSPACELSLTMLSAAAAISPGERLIVTYRTQLDADTEDGVALTNVAGAIEWFNGDNGNATRSRYSRTLTNGTVGIDDHEDAHTVTSALFGYFFEKSVANLTTGVSPTTTAAPGDTLRYTLRLQTTDSALDNVSFRDDLGALNPTAVFVPGSLTLVPGTLPPGADASNTDPNGGTNGAGQLDIRNLSLPADSEIYIQFDMALAAMIPDDTIVTNQAELFGAVKLADSDDPYVNGQANPAVAGDEDPTQVVIQAAPYFEVEKVSAYLTGDPAVLLAGETLRYTITVRNVGTDEAVDAVIVDQVPANTTYVTGSTTLNGVAVPDAAGGISPLVNGLLINAAGSAAPGSLPVSSAPAAGGTATIVFDVVVDPDVADGTVISNQAFVSAPASEVFNTPSDDPRTPIADDPTRDIVGRLPLLFSTKLAALELDQGTPGIVDPGDTLRYTITIYNNGTVPATLVELVDQGPANTTYLADTTTLNGLPLAAPDGGIFPLGLGLPVSSADLTPPLPGTGEGTLSPGESAVVEFVLRVNDDATPGTLIVNQATVSTYELPDLLTDGDGNPATGPEPTVVVVGNVQQLSITKQVAVVGGGIAEAGSTVEYLVNVTNIASVPAYYVVIYDDLDLPDAGQLSYVDQSATMNGLADGVSFNGSLLTADYFATNGPLEPGETIELRFRAVIEPTLPIGTPVTNIAEVRWNSPEQSATASVTFDVGGMPGSGAINGSVWHDANFDNVADTGERLLEGWTVEIWRDATRVTSTFTDADGNYRVSGLVPNYLTNEIYEVRFFAPGAGSRTGSLGLADSEFTDYPQRISDIVVDPGSNLDNLNLPIDPNGVVYNSLGRTPVSGAVVTLLQGDNGPPLPGACFDDPVQQNQITLADGYYKFDVNFSDPACFSGGAFTVQVTPPSGSFVVGPSEIIPPADSGLMGPFDVPACPGSVDDAVPLTGAYCEVQVAEFAPGPAIPAASAGTAYYLYVQLDDTQPPGSSQIFNNHIPLDPELSGSVAITKTTPMTDVTRGQLVPYLITVDNSIGLDLADVSVVDRFPAGFRYVEGSAQIDGVAVEPVVNGRELAWTGLTLTAEGRHEIKLLLAVGAGVNEGEFINRAQVVNGATGEVMSGEAAATVRLVPDPTFDCTDVMGKVFDDVNRNGYQDGDETGLGGVRLVTPRGLAATTDNHGRFHITCAITPHEGRGSNFTLKLDDRTLPSGFRLSTRPVQIKRATRGKALHFNFGASIHRVVGLDLADAVFRPGETELHDMWQPRLGLLLEELQKGPAVLRLSYLADVEEPRLVDRRVKALKRQIENAWKGLACCYELAIETEVHWRLGGPPDRSRSVEARDR